MLLTRREKKKGSRGENYPWALANSRSEVHSFASKSEASTTPRQLHPAAAAGAASAPSNNLPGSISAQLGSISHGLSVSGAARAPGSKLQPKDKPAAPKTNPQPRHLHLEQH